MAAKRPRRQRKGDRLLNPGSTKAEIECDYSVAPLDRLAITMDEKWGIDRLPELVSVETARKYGSAMAKLNAALEEGEPQEVARRAQVCIRGLHVMDQEAEAANQPKAAPEYFEYEIDGFKFAIMKDGHQWKTHHADRPDLRFFSLREVGVALRALKIDNPIFAEVQKHFPASEITSIAQRTSAPLDDPLPF